LQRSNAIHHEQGTFKTIGLKNDQAVDGWAGKKGRLFKGLDGTRS
jgi:hypothetical protein